MLFSLIYFFFYFLLFTQHNELDATDGGSKWEYALNTTVGKTSKCNQKHSHSDGVQRAAGECEIGARAMGGGLCAREERENRLIQMIAFENALACIECFQSV